MITSDWKHCYNEGWKGEIVPEAFCHPAKYSRALIRRIYQHMMEEGWFSLGAIVVDPFGGVALGGLDAMKHGLNFISVELEEKFVNLGNQNIDLWNKRYAAHFPGWGTARIIQGDSRRLIEVIKEAWVCISSPPYSETGLDFHKNGLLEDGQKLYHRPYMDGMQATISSPPYAESMNSEKSGVDWSKCHREDGSIRNKTIEPSYRGDVNNISNLLNYGSTHGQLGSMRANGFEASISSPPYEGAIANRQHEGTPEKYYERQKRYNDNHPEYKRPSAESMWYGGSDGQLAAEYGNDFWSAARLIVEQVYQILSPGAHACWVVKSFVKNKKIVDFPVQWQQMCEAVGFETLHYHKCWLIEDRGTQIDLEGNHHHKQVERKSFFRRLAENKGSPRIDYEVVLCMQKPGKGGGNGLVSSPPFLGELPGDHNNKETYKKFIDQNHGVGSIEFNYGTTLGNLGNMRAGNFEEMVGKS